MTGRVRASVASASLLVLGACGGAAQAPGCDAEPTTRRAMREAFSVIGERGGMRRVPGNPDRLISSRGDTVSLNPGGGHMWVNAADVRAVGTMENIRTVNRHAGTWTCAADFVLTSLLDDPDPVLRGPIEYRSEITQGPGPREHVVRVVLAGPGG